MITVCEVGSVLYHYDPKRIMHCPECNRRHIFYYAAPCHCTNCDKELPDLMEMLQPRTADAKRLEYHTTGKTKRDFDFSRRGHDDD